ncbi:MAG: FAD-dependent oxidoreductase [Bacteroidales bacterium]
MTNENYDIVIYGASSAGIIAGVAAAKQGRFVIIVEPSGHLGGLTTGGLGQTDIGVEGEGGAIGGMSFDLYRKILQHYMNDNTWTYQTWDEYRGRTNRLQEWGEGMFGFEPKVVRKVYEDKLKEAGVSYHVGRESNDRYDEILNGVQIRCSHDHIFHVKVKFTKGCIDNFV